ncbi:flavin-dependent oxidoreductase [Plantactinospora endophytica]|uniref:Flavin-dependent oxidoreductase n=1 Tax=Plantactinospora endophytica TaxID=673535 RepID=A0ABQ4E6U6_9ACTN|nr:flavin-dependent oxidoreductase [Plantactinospora endophytica]GIG90427.1 flavin-dependent oxidoreductase [Plantactinospora endophytica]
MDILIAGAGIGGLTLALSLRTVGFERIRVLEAAPRIEPLGVGLNILPNAVRELAELGLADRLADLCVPTGELSYYDRFGSLVWNEPRGLGAGYRWPQFSIHRGRLQQVLLDAVRERLGPAAVVTDARVRDAQTRPDRRVEVLLEHPAAGGGSRCDADLVVGADGIHSAVRAALYPEEGPPPWNGLLVWRGATWSPPFLDGRTMIIAGDLGRRVVAYPMTPPRPDGRVLVNWAVARPARTDERLDRADWNRPVDPETFLPDFADLRFDWLDVPGLVRGGDEALVYPMVDREPLPRWTFGAVTLLGDAAHAMYPMGSNGATQSIVDARVLAYHLAGLARRAPAGGVGDELDAALAAYERDRRPVTTELQRNNRQMGPEVVINLAAERAPDGFRHIHDVVPAEELAEISQRYARTAGFDVQTVNGRPSYGVPAPSEEVPR